MQVKARGTYLTVVLDLGQGTPGTLIADLNDKPGFNSDSFPVRSVECRATKLDIFGRVLVTGSYSVDLAHDCFLCRNFAGVHDVRINVRELHGSDSDMFAYVELHWQHEGKKHEPGGFVPVTTYSCATGLLSGALTDADF